MTKQKRAAGEAERWAVYCRCSTDDQAAGDYTTLEVQEKKNKEYVTKHGGQVIGVYVDDGKTGTNLNRPQFKRLLADAQAGKIDKVCVTYMSRLGRGDSYTIAKYQLSQVGVCVEMVEEQFAEGVEGYLTQQMTVLMDGMYPKMVSKWTRTKLQQMAKDGLFTGGRIIFGFRTKTAEGYGEVREGDKRPPQVLVPDPHDAEIVRDAFNLYAESSCLARVRDYLKAVTSIRWTTTKVKCLLTNESYIGNRIINGVRYEDTCPIIVGKDVWDKVQAGSAQQGTRAPRTDDYIYLLRGKVECPHCGCLYTNSSVRKGDDKIRYYACLNHLKHLTVCPVVRVNADALHETVLHQVRKAAESEATMRYVISESGGWQSASETKVALRNQLIEKRKTVFREIENLTNAIAQGATLKSLIGRLERLEQEQDNINLSLQTIEDEIAAETRKCPTSDEVQESWSKYLSLWEQANDEEREILFSALVQKVTVNEKDHVTIQLSPVVDIHGLFSQRYIEPEESKPPSGKFDITYRLGAGAGLEPATFGL